jgi:hypothetical protein
MKKHILTLGLALIALTEANAQSMSIGPEAGLNLSTMMAKYNGVTNTGEYLPGLKIGGIFDIGLSPMLSLQPGLMFQMKGYKNDFTSTVVINNLTYQQTEEATVRANYLEIPLNLQLNINAGRGDFFVGAGPYAAFALGGSVNSKDTRTLATNTEGTTTTTEHSRDLEVGENVATDDIMGTDVGLNINTGYKWNSGLLIRGNAGFGLMNIQPGGDDMNSLRNFTVGLSVGYLFGL